MDLPMIALPAGMFHQGSAGATGDDFGWQHDQPVPAFELDVTEVTVEAYQRCLDAGVCFYGPRSDKCNMERPRDEYRRDPVNCVTYAEALRYCEWRGATLPTDGMWEYAAGGRRGWYWPWEARPTPRSIPPGTTGDVFVARRGTCRERVPVAEARLPGRMAYREDTTCPTGTFPRGDTPEGVKDLEGNVAEWTSTAYCKHHERDCESGTRTVKGMSYSTITSGIAHREGVPETDWRPTIGFRCARLKKSPAKAGN